MKIQKKYIERKEIMISLGGEVIWEVKYRGLI